MRYIKKYKIFESSTRMYREVSEQEYTFGTKPDIDFEGRYVDSFDFQRWGFKCDGYVSTFIREDGHISLHIENEHTYEYLKITQTEDEYFKISHDNGDDYIEYYICDQIEGLIQYLKDNGILK